MRKRSRESPFVSRGPASEAVLRGTPGALHGVRKGDLSEDLFLLDVSPILCHAGT